jgi:hypothetical protein
MDTLLTNSANWYLRMLMPLSDETKLDLISKLTAAMSRKNKTEVTDSHFFDGLTGTWENGKSPEDEITQIRDSRMSGVTRKIVDF